MSNSVWMDGQKLPKFGKLTGSVKTDVLVIGEAYAEYCAPIFCGKQGWIVCWPRQRTSEAA